MSSSSGSATTLRMARASGAMMPWRSISATSAATASRSACTASRLCWARWARSASAVARDTSSSAARARTASSARRASRIVCSCRSVAALSTSVSSSARSTSSRSVLERRDALVHQPLALDRRLEQPRPLGAHQLDVATAGLGALGQLAGGFLEPLHLGHRGQRPLGQPGVLGAGFRGPLAEGLGVVAGVGEPALRVAERGLERSPARSASRAIDAWASA